MEKDRYVNNEGGLGYFITIPDRRLLYRGLSNNNNRGRDKEGIEFLKVSQSVKTRVVKTICKVKIVMNNV